MLLEIVVLVSDFPSIFFLLHFDEACIDIKISIHQDVYFLSKLKLNGQGFNLASPMDLILVVGKLVVHLQAKDVVLASFIFVVWAILSCHNQACFHNLFVS